MAVLALGTSIFTARISQDAEDRATHAQQRADEEAKKAQASLVTYGFQDGQSVTIENHSKAQIGNVVLVFEDVHKYVHFDLIDPCGWLQVQQLPQNKITGHAFIKFTDSQNIAWEKHLSGDRAGLREVVGTDPPQDAKDITSALEKTAQRGFLQNC